jgi:RNA polymerase sigma-70 factor (ECF subfamily)
MAGRRDAGPAGAVTSGSPPRPYPEEVVEEVVEIPRSARQAAARPGEPFDLAEAADRDAVERVLDGDREAFAGVVRRHGGRLVGLCARLTGDRGLGEELAQEALARAFAGLASWRGDAGFRAWLTRVAVNACRDWQKAGARAERPEELDPAVLATTLDPERVAAGRELGRALSAAVARLPPANREAFVLFHVEGLPYEEIRAVTGVSVTALKVRVHRARQRLLEELGPLVNGA